ncbi:hypothetical protein TD95_002524 [Thielaviopsis punctulata]|uniref:Protein SQS1 n=1 Tax=Thielaviopsis punctulata TaxID=72032 RepID=A0A0F4ZGP9_9PEZI|nr:hypothetical protein TD95_002524 [Thielaviopsis punctulata]
MVNRGSQRRIARRSARQRKKNKKRFGCAPPHLVKTLVIDELEDMGEEQESDTDLMLKDYLDNMAENGDEFVPTSWSRRDLGGEEGDVFFGQSSEDESVDPVAKSNAPKFVSAGHQLTTQVTVQDAVAISTESAISATPGTIDTPSDDSVPEKAEDVSYVIDTDAGLLDNHKEPEGTNGHEDEEKHCDEDKGNEDDENIAEDDELDEEDEVDDDDDFFNQDIISVFPRQSSKKKGKNSIFALARNQNLVPDLDEVLQHTRAAPKRKGKGVHPFFNDDLQLDIKEIALKSMNINRAKKAQKKRRRELLRSQGILGLDEENLAVKYPTGMTYEQITHELWVFISTEDQEQLNLPAMTPDFRKGVHELAHNLNLISKSTGNGDSRRPILYKKGYEIVQRHKFETIIDRIGRRHFRSSYKGGNARWKHGDKTRGGNTTSGSQSTKYMEGEIVGGSLPHIGTENRGHELLKKMGWSRGTALGSTDNKGILEPVMQKVKTSRSGLG